MGITISNNSPKGVFCIQLSVWFVTVFPFMVADLYFHYLLENAEIITFGDAFEYIFLALCLLLGTAEENTLYLWLKADGFTRLSLLCLLIIFGLVVMAQKTQKNA